MVGAESGPIDRHVLRLFDRKLQPHPIVASTAYDPDPYEPRRLQTSFANDRYPKTIEGGRLDVRWFETGDFGFHYREDHETGVWQCRWDRHPNPHNARCHFHEPPDCASVVDLSLPDSNPLSVLFTVLGAIEDRIDGLRDP
jgi:hypothetical protein